MTLDRNKRRSATKPTDGSAEGRPSLACHALSKSALPLARRLAARLAAEPWRAPCGDLVAACLLSAPARLQARDARPFQSLADFLAREYQRRAAHVFIGAAGIAVRVLAPLLGHKSQDPPVVVLDPAGRFAISLLAGHWGGGNDLTRHLARLLDATPVITTASDQPSAAAEASMNAGLKTGALFPSASDAPTQIAPGPAPRALDLLIRDAGLRILDWQHLPRAQAARLEGLPLRLWDPCAALPDAAPPAFERLPGKEEDAGPFRPDSPESVEPGEPGESAAGPFPLLAAHWRRLAPAPGLLRLAVPRLYVGLGCRKNLPPEAALTALEGVFAMHNLELRAVAGLATVTEKLAEPALRMLAERLGAPLRGFAAEELAQCATPNPSEAAGRRFGLAPFSVCEAAALLAARGCPECGGAAVLDRKEACLLIPKHAVQARITLAVALAAQTP